MVLGRISVIVVVVILPQQWQCQGIDTRIGRVRSAAIEYIIS